MQEVMSVNQKEYEIVKLLGHGKGGYSYLAKREGNLYVLKQIHHEPCEYYSFGNKIEAEQNDYNRLLQTGIRIPRMLDIDIANERILKEYIDGPTIYDLVKNDAMKDLYLMQMREMAKVVYEAGLNIDYFPTNFIVQDEKIFYIDYECNNYMCEWNFENWGIKYWSKTQEFIDYMEQHEKGENMESDIIKISHLNKSFGEVKAVNDLSFCVKKGELFAFLGVNGAGKSTTISILCGLQKKDSGSVQINGIETDKAGAQTKRMLGVVFQDSVLDKPLTVKENLMSRAALYGITGNAFDKRLQELVGILDFDEFLNRPVGKLSGGQRRRIDIARALLHRPEILILDEPTTGLDPQTRQLIWNVIEKLQKTENMTVFLTTHYMEEAEQICTRIAIMDKGQQIAIGTKDELKKMIKNTETVSIEIPELQEENLEALGSMEHVYKTEYDEGKLTLNFSGGTHNLIHVLDYLKDKNLVFGRVYSELPTLNDVFLEITGKELRDV